MLSSVGAEICNNCNKRGQRDKCYKMVLKDEDIFNFFRWISAYKLLQKKDNLNQLGLKDFYFKELLKQTLKDFDKQDKPCEYDYNIKVIGFEIKPVEERKSYLGL